MSKLCRRLHMVAALCNDDRCLSVRPSLCLSHHITSPTLTNIRRHSANIQQRRTIQ